jgi:glycosyltransferase involved in cell wall biosynthesis
MNIAFYAPMKPPSSSVPSGDRRMALAFIEALGWAGHRVEVATDFVSREPLGDPKRQRAFCAEGTRIAEGLLEKFGAKASENRPQIWFTYHLYYKAPDWIGPIVADGLGIPYVVAEASFAPKRAGGPWDQSHRAVGTAIARADLIFGLNSADRACVLPLLADPSRLIELKPFLSPSTPTLPRLGQAASSARLLTVAMMRPGAKLDSYRVLARALGRLPPAGWHLTVVGDGSAEAEVRALLDRPEVVFAGRLSGDELLELQAASDLFVWPAIGEAYGMAILEAQAAGLPVVAGRAGGVADIVRHGETGLLTPEGDADALGDAIASLIMAPARRQTMGTAAARKARDEHGFAAAAERIDERLRALVP